MRRLAKIGLWVLIVVGLVGGGLYVLANRSASLASAALLSQVREVAVSRGPWSGSPGWWAPWSPWKRLRWSPGSPGSWRSSPYGRGIGSAGGTCSWPWIPAI